MTMPGIHDRYVMAVINCRCHGMLQGYRGEHEILLEGKAVAVLRHAFGKRLGHAIDQSGVLGWWRMLLRHGDLLLGRVISG